MRMPQENHNPIETAEQERLRKWRSEFQDDYKAHSVWTSKKGEWERFYDGEQLSSDEKKALRERRQPEVVINLIKPRIDGVVGEFLGRRVMMRARDKGSADFEVAKHITEALRYVEDQNRFDEQESRVAEDMFIGGVGWYKLNLEFDFLEPEIKISYRTNDDIIIDRRCRRRDMKDAKRLYETVWVEVEDLVELYPQHEKEIREAAQKTKEPQGFADKLRSYIGDDYDKTSNASSDTGWDFETFLDPGRNRIRLINVWERVQKRVEFAFHPDLEENVVEVTDYTKDDLDALKANYNGIQLFARTRWELNSGIFIATKILEDRKNVRPHDSEGKFPFARAIGHVEKSDLRTPYGMVKQYIDAQKEYNKRRSKLLHKSNTNRIVAEKGSIPDSDVERLRKEASKPDGVVLYNQGRQFQIDKDAPTQSDVFLLQLAQSEIEQSGIAGEFIGQESSSISGKAIQLRQVSGLKMLRPFYAALRAARRDIFTIALEEMQQYWTSQKLVKITDDAGAGEIILNQRKRDPITGRVTIDNNLKLGKYDIKVDEDLESANQRQEIFNQIAQLGQVALKAGEPFPLDMLIKASDLPNKEEWLKAIAGRRELQMQMQQAQMMAQAGAAQNGQNVTPT